MANDPLTAIAEKLGPDLVGRPIPPGTLEAWAVTRLPLPVKHRCADLESAACLGHGVIPSELTSAAVPYETAQAWAAAWADAGLEGVRYTPRHDPRPGMRSTALFGDRGDASADHRNWPGGDRVSAADYSAELATTFEVDVVEIPLLSQVTVVTPD